MLQCAMDEAVDRIIKEFGGTSAMAVLCEVAPSAVSQWKRKKRIPKAHLKFLRLQRPDLFEGGRRRRGRGEARQ